MKNVLIYNIIDEKRCPNDILINLLKAQIDNSLRFNWDPKDIILGTNFDFEYKGVKNHKLNNICTYNPFVNKWYGMLELMENKVLTDNFWFHDQDNWQMDYLEFPQFEGEVAGCTYVCTPEWNTASMFIKSSAIDIIRYIKEFMDLNQEFNWFSDENYLAVLRSHTEIKNYLTTINNQYNVGLTCIESRYNVANKPIKVIGFKPENEKSMKVFLGDNPMKVSLVDQDLLDIFKKYSLNEFSFNS